MSWRTWSHPKRHCVPLPVSDGILESSVLTTIATSTSSPAAATHRPGWRRGTALIGVSALSSGGPPAITSPASSPSCVGSERGVVDLGCLDSPRLHAPVPKDVAVDAVLDEDV